MRESILTSEAGYAGSISVKKREAKTRHRESDSTNSKLMVPDRLVLVQLAILHKFSLLH
jgi:hypothetical protein